MRQVHCTSGLSQHWADTSQRYRSFCLTCANDFQVWPLSGSGKFTPASNFGVYRCWRFIPLSVWKRTLMRCLAARVTRWKFENWWTAPSFCVLTGFAAVGPPWSCIVGDISSALILGAMKNWLDERTGNAGCAVCFLYDRAIPAGWQRLFSPRFRTILFKRTWKVGLVVAVNSTFRIWTTSGVPSYKESVKLHFCRGSSGRLCWYQSI